MQLLRVDEQLVDLMAVQQRLLGNYSQLLIDMCGIIDRSESTDGATHLLYISLNLLNIILNNNSIINI